MKRITTLLALIATSTLISQASARADGVNSCTYTEGIVTYDWNCGEYRDKNHNLVYPVCGTSDPDTGNCTGTITGANQCCG